MQYLNICKLMPIFNDFKFIKMQEMGLIFQKKNPGGVCPRPLRIASCCGDCLLRAYGARSFAAAPLMKYALAKDPNN